MALTGCGLLLHARRFWQLGWRAISAKFRSGLLPHFQLHLHALLFHVCTVVLIEFGPLYRNDLSELYVYLYVETVYNL
jgi:hypothetical protein